MGKTFLGVWGALLNLAFLVRHQAVYKPSKLIHPTVMGPVFSNSQRSLRFPKFSELICAVSDLPIHCCLLSSPLPPEWEKIHNSIVLVNKVLMTLPSPSLLG